MTFVKKGVILSKGMGSDPDATSLFLPCIINVGKLWYLYYSGFNLAVGRGCLAISPDGVTFTKKGVVLDLGTGSDPDITTIRLSHILHVRSNFWLYYAGFSGATGRVCLAISPDGVTFTKKGVIIDVGSGGDFDSIIAQNLFTIYHDGVWWGYYSGTDGVNYRIGLAMSSDGITWVKKGVVLDIGADGEFDDVGVQKPCVLIRNGVWWLYYSGNDGAKLRMGVALSTDGFTFVKKGVVIDTGALAPDNVYAYHARVILRNGAFWAYYVGRATGTLYYICLAISPDGM